MATDTAVKQYPQVGEIFELELDADAPENTPLGMVQAFGYDPKGWDFAGTPLTGKCRGKFKLVQIGHQPHLEAIQTALEAEYGPTPSGQWIKAFKCAFPEADGNGPVGIADTSWIRPSGNDNFPFVESNGKPDFTWTGTPYKSWRWLVAVPDDEENDAETEN